MKHAVWLTACDGIDAARMVELGVLAERAGWDGVFVSDSPPHEEYPDPFVVLSGIAARTDDVTLGTWASPLARRQPWQVAGEVATLDRLSGGRVLLGVGIGNEEDYAAYGQAFDASERVERLDEALDVVTGLWRDEPFSYDGEYYRLEHAEVRPTPLQEPRVPVLLAGRWPDREPITRGARWDGIVPYFASLVGGEGPHGEQGRGRPAREVRDALAFYRERADEGGEVVLPTVPTEDPDAFAEEAAALGVTWLLATDLGESAEAVERRIREGPPAEPVESR